MREFRVTSLGGVQLSILTLLLDDEMLQHTALYRDGTITGSAALAAA